VEAHRPRHGVQRDTRPFFRRVMDLQECPAILSRGEIVFWKFVELDEQGCFSHARLTTFWTR
jgi:hypothetical protein